MHERFNKTNFNLTREVFKINPKVTAFLPRLQLTFLFQ